MDRDRLDLWLKAYGEAWQETDADAFTALFTPDVRYFWTPFQEPQKGRKELAEAFREATSTQQEICFGWRILANDAELSIAHWSCSFTRKASETQVRLDGIFLLRFKRDGLCSELREWWHSDEGA
ncbi:MAG TPA: nuclear transport factor 2 family protein [Acidobacteriota bacterium]|nr:nuclear transport factor 2 family protein [Acidobacteriota bacterium]